MKTRRRIYGVVVLLPRSLSRPADRVRRSFDPNFGLIGPHVTVLPPRPLPLTRRQVLQAVEAVALGTPPFRLTLGKVRTFLPVMPVVFAGLRAGAGKLEILHRRLSREPLRGPEAFPYVPHVTLAQGPGDDHLRRAAALSRKIFAPRASRRAWLAESLVVVERLSRRRWILLDPLPLGGGPPKGRRPAASGRS